MSVNSTNILFVFSSRESILVIHLKYLLELVLHNSVKSHYQRAECHNIRV
jgi:hypothetical protein